MANILLKIDIFRSVMLYYVIVTSYVDRFSWFWYQWKEETPPYSLGLYYGTKQLYFGRVNLKSQAPPPSEEKQTVFWRGYCIPNQKCAYFVLFLKIISTFFKVYTSYSKLSKKLKNDIKISRPSSSWVFDQNNTLIVLIQNLKTACPTQMPIPFLGYLDNLLYDACMLHFQKNIDN